jgi:hypothetical protein
MPVDKDRKRVIRNRMKKTGESYTAARAQILSKPHAAKPPVRSVDYAALAGMSDEKIAAKTGRTWREWVTVLDADDAATMSHGKIATLVHGKHHVGDWWAQSVTVGYERIKGLRERGQRRDGAYEISKTRTYDVPVSTLFRVWADDASRESWLDGVKSTVRKATAPKGLRLQWPDGAIVVVSFIAKSPAKSVVSLAHTKLRSKSAAEDAKAFWTARLDALASQLAGRGKVRPTRARQVKA